MTRQDALAAAMQLLTSGKIAPQVQVTPGTLIDTARQIHEFLNPQLPAEAPSEMPSEPSTKVGSARNASKQTPAQPDSPPEF